VIEVAASEEITEGDDLAGAPAARAILGYLLARPIAITACCNHRADHYVTGTLAAVLAERHHGVIDLPGALNPPDMPWRDGRFAGRQRVASDPGQRTLGSLEAISQDVAAMPGTVHQLFYDVSDCPIWVRHIVDATFPRSRLRHPHFHIVT
jgi:hypothetical protein